MAAARIQSTIGNSGRHEQHVHHDPEYDRAEDYEMQSPRSKGWGVGWAIDNAHTAYAWNEILEADRDEIARTVKMNKAFARGETIDLDLLSPRSKKTAKAAEKTHEAQTKKMSVDEDAPWLPVWGLPDDPLANAERTWRQNLKVWIWEIFEAPEGNKFSHYLNL